MVIVRLMNYYFMKLNSPRPTFPGDMTPEERQMMMEHGAYWMEQIKRGKALVIGPVADPKGAFGLGILRVEDPAEPVSYTHLTLPTNREV